MHPREGLIDGDTEVAVNGQIRNRRASTTDPNNHLIVDKVPTERRQSVLLEDAKQAGQLLSGHPSEQTASVTLAISEGEGALGREATWDDFPNGRFGDSRSPAFGDIDGYGPSLHMSHSQAVSLWGYPVSADDISDLFVRHINGTLSAIPWSEQALSDETRVIKDEILALNKKGWWTVASQPAVNCCRSDDPTFGWGPKGGFVWQKAFVEFFCPKEDLDRLEEKLNELGNNVVSFYAASGSGDAYKSNMAPTQDAMNAVTWGTFKGKE